MFTRIYLQLQRPGREDSLRYGSTAKAEALPHLETKKIGVRVESTRGNLLLERESLSDMGARFSVGGRRGQRRGQGRVEWRDPSGKKSISRHLFRAF